MLHAHSPAVPAPLKARHRVMIVDDSVVVRGLVSRWVGEAPDFEVVSAVANGRIALEKLDEARPDIVLLDLDMPELDGVATIPLLLARRPAASVIVVSTMTKRSAEISLRCLSLGAIDYLTKPGSQQQVASGSDFRRELMARLEGIAAHLHRAADRPVRPERPVCSPAPRRERQPAISHGLGLPPRCLLIGASTGGPRAVIHLLKGVAHLSPRIPILIVQHMPPIFTTVFAEQVSHETGLLAREGQDGEILEPGRVYIAPGGRHMGLSLQSGEPAIRLDDSAPVQHCRPAVDILFGDAAKVFGAAGLGVVLTGMGSDGTAGARALSQAGGIILAQDEATSTIWGMPGSVAKAGLARSVLPLDAMAPAIDAVIGRRGV
jgi:two-component system chemotaxis response regulator CheB